MTRVWCEKHKCICNAYNEWNKKRTKVMYLEGKCGCRFKEKEIEDIKVHHRTRFFLKDGSELVRFGKPKWIRKEKNVS